MDSPLGSPLPVMLAPLYGREHDLSQLLTLLRGGVRLLTLRGPGGIGKTTLALHLAQALRENRSSPHGDPQFDHVQVIDLSAVREPERVMGLIAASLDGGSSGAPERRIHAFAAGRRTLLILDNFEQLLAAALGLGDLLAATETLRLVVTSRTALRLHDEAEYPVEPLTLAHRVRDAASSAAVQLFVARVQAVQPSFELTSTTASQVVRLCEVLEGVPLALELAAMRTRTYALGDLLARLERPLEVLKADFRDRPERLRSLRAAVQWSYDLLGDVDRTVFECCAVFDGPFTPQALVDVWGSPDVLDRAEALLEQSLLQRLDTPETFWKMLQPLKELAVERLEGHPQVAVWRERQAQHFLNMVEKEWRSRELEIVNSWDEYLPHYPNIRAGLVWTVEERRSDLAYRYLAALRSIWASFGLFVQEAPLVERVLALPEPEDRVTLLRALEVSADSLNFTGQFQACEARLHRISELCRELNDGQSAAWATFGLAVVARDTGQGERAWEMVQQVIRELREQTSATPLPRTQRFLWANAHRAAALDLLGLGRHEEALEYAQLACEYHRDMGNRYFELNSMITVGCLLVYVNRLSEARPLLLSCLHDAVNKSLRGVVIHALRLGLTLVAAEQQEWTTLVQFAAFVNEPSWESAQSMSERRLRQDMARAREALGEIAYQQAWTAGTSLQLADMVELAERLAQMPISPTIQPTSRSALTPREQEVLALVAQGHPDRKVARLLSISPTTVSKHVSNLLGKLGLHNRVELTRWAIQQETNRTT
ncbi:NACHT domain-containing protein [Deinococcus detaillensis]|uniref:NACHT domain-containing protein n=1 Tax=Deinococcus detaillensis TaxID=2592048 RepID=A0A553UP28_9DEIO|nr:LuxR C-terminal-related transcriptional regulator [Deinococcus detaillensis]TSA81711.1 NACHT domain-containing protein [Deinococcus detaillensis]